MYHASNIGRVLQSTLAVMALGVLWGCPSVHTTTAYFDDMIGKPIERFVAVAESPLNASVVPEGFTPRRYQLENGNGVYVHLTSKRCEVHLEYDTSGIIVAYRLFGKACYAW